MAQLSFEFNGVDIVGTSGTTITLPSSTATLVGESTTSTLTNKTINGANNTLTVRVANDISGFGTGVATALAVNVGSSGAFVTNGGALGTPSSGTLTNATGLPVTSGISGMGTGIATFLATPSSANLISAVTDETGTGSLVFGTTPTLSTPVINNPRWGYTTTATAAGTTTLTNTSNFIQIFTGTSNQTIVMPVTSTLAAGQSWEIHNNSTGTLTVNSSGGNLIVSIIAGQSYALTCIGTTLTTAADWDAEWNGANGITGTGSVVLSTSPTLTTPSIGVATGTSFNSITGLSSTTPSANSGAGSVGTGVTVARADHVHPIGSTLTIGTGLSGTSYNGSSAVTIAIDSTVATTSGTQTLTNKTLSTGTTLSANLAAGTNKITGLGDPTAAQDAATKAYVDTVAQGLDVKPSVRAATTSAGTLASSFANAQVVDGVTLATNDRILIKNQASSSENGIYTVNASGAPTRATDMDVAAEFPGAFTFVEEGTTNADTGWVCTNNAPVTVGTTAITFSQFSGAGTYTAGNGLTLTGSQFTINTSITADLSTSQTLTNKTLTAPRISSASNIADSNGNELILFPSAVASAVNEITVSNAATGVSPSITASGGDPNISLNLVAKGTGTVQAGGVAVVTISGSQTLTNKTLTSPVISSISNTGTLTLPTSTDTLVGRATTDTFSNKTISGTSNTITNVSLTTGVTGTLPVANGGTGITALGTGVATALGTNIGSAGAFITNGGALGTPSSGTLTNATGLPVTSGISGLGTGVATFLATPSSANLISAITDETGSGSLVFGTTPTLSQPVINNPRWGYTTTATAAGTTTLTATSSYLQVFTGASNQTVVMPVTNTLATGQSWEIENNSTGTLTVNSSGGNLIVSINPGHSYALSCIGTSLTTAADWNAEWNGSSSITGTGANVLATSPTLTTPNIGVATGTSFNSITGLSSTTPSANSGAGSVGTGVTVARADHVHPIGSTLTIGTGLSGTSYNGSSAVTIAIDSTVATLTGTQTLTNKTLTTPIISSISNSGTVTIPTGTVTLATLTGTETLTNKTLTAPKFADLGFIADANGNELIIMDTVASAVNEITVANAATGNAPTITASGETNVSLNLVAKGSGTVQAGGVPVVTTTGTQTLTNKTLTSPIISSISNTGTLTLPTSTDTLVGRATTDTLTNKTLTTPIISSISNTGTLTLPTSTDTLVGRATTDTLTNKTINGASNTLTVRLANDISGFGTGVATALAVNTGSAGAFVVNGGALGTPSSATLTNATGLPVTSGISGLGTGIATFLATPSSANLISAITDETGTGSLVFATSPSFTTAITLNATGELRLADTDSSHYVGFKSPATVTTNRIWTLPSADGTNGQVLTTDGAGVLSWSTSSGGTGFANETMVIMGAY